MSLFVDGNISTIEQLRAYDSSILTVSNVEQIDLEAKLQLAQVELGAEIQEVFARDSPLYGSEITPATLNLGPIVVTEPLRQWHCVRTLSLVYRDAYFSQINDRYYGRWQEYLQLDGRLSALLLGTGIGITSDPLARPASPVITLSEGSNSPAIYYFRVAWVNSAGQEGQGSLVTPLIAEQFHTLSVAPPAPPANAVSWNLYVGASDTSVTRQNSGALDLDSTWQLLAEGLQTSGPPANEGQQPDYYFRIRKVRQRG
ncbi:MAG: hypothetical protein ABI693_20720 [Bryobacteraceae bacterium]